MAVKTYKLNIEKSDGTSESVSFTIPGFIGTYNIKFNLSDGQEIDAGNITVDGGQRSYNLKLILSNGSTINAGTIITPVGVPKPTFANASWEEIADISEAGNASEYFKVGDEKTIELSTGDQITLVILGFNHDDLTNGGKAGMTIGMKNLLTATYSINSSGSNEGGWAESEMRTSTMETLFSQLQSDLQSVIKEVNKKSLAGGNTTDITVSSDKLFIFSLVEVNGATLSPYKNEGEQYEYWKTVKDGEDTVDRIKYLSNGGGSSYGWWTRTPTQRSDTYGRIFNDNGFIYETYIDYRYGVCLCFCV